MCDEGDFSSLKLLAGPSGTDPKKLPLVARTFGACWGLKTKVWGLVGPSADGPEKIYRRSLGPMCNGHSDLAI